MKPVKLFLFFFLSFVLYSTNLLAQVKKYDAQWKKVDELIQKKNLPKSALEEVKKIYTLAKKENQEAQVIKALVYMSSLQESTREENQSQSIKEIEAEIASAKEPTASILKSLLAGKYWQYFQNNRYRIYGRTNTTNFDKADIATWTVEDLHKKISELYFASIRNETLLKSTKLEPYDAIIIKGNARSLRPTLYDLLAHSALFYFRNSETDLKKPAFAFEIVQPEAFAPATKFVTAKFTTADSLSLKHKALLIYQELIAFHLNDAKPDALIDVDIDRLQYVFQNSTSETKDSLYTSALQTLIQKYQSNAAIKQAQYLLALWHENKGATYEPFKDTAFRFSRMKAREILINVVKDSAVKNEGWTNSYNLLKAIETKSFSFEVENVNLPSQPFRALVKYRNLAGLNFRIIRIDEALEKEVERNDVEDRLWLTLIKAKPVKSWLQTLPATNDLQQHGVEIKIDGLSVGKYYLLASADAKFDKASILGAGLFHVSNISFINQQDKFFVLNRETGQPLVKANATVYLNEYDYKTYKYTKTKLGTYQTDIRGYFKIPSRKTERGYNYYVDISHQNDRLNLDQTLYHYYYRDNDAPKKPVKRTFFFTDRSIYRPGQTVYFKGIVINALGTQNEILVNHKTKIYLRNANYQIADSIEVTTNEFGSFNAKFQLPQNTLNGNFYLVEKEQNSTASFSVEEYKRPKFAVEFGKVKNSYKVNEKVTITGTAKAYAGNNIDGAKVSYRVVRKPRFIYTWYFSKWWMPQAPEMEIAHGEAKTDKDGKFNIIFTAVPDKTIDLKFEPVFDYHVYADVTDINGETRSGHSVVTAGYKSLLLQVNIPERVSLDSLKNISIRTENMNGEYQPSTITVSFTKLQPEQRLIRSRYWEQPDQFVMSKEEYVSYFPHDEYSNETDQKNWKKEGTVSKTDSTRVNGQWAIDNGQLTTGFYEVTVVTRDKDGKEVKDIRYVELFDPKSDRLSKPEYLWVKESDKPIEPGETATVQIGSSADNIFLINQVDRQQDNTAENPVFNFNSLNNEKKTFSYSATEADRGGYGIIHFFVKHNRFYQFNDVVSVPWSNKEIDIEWATFRDKTLPGSEEKWKIRIKGYKNEKIAAEMLASMYDASLDQFRMHNWSKPNIWPVYYNRIQWNKDLNFKVARSWTKDIWFENRQYQKLYDRFIFNEGYYTQYEGFFGTGAAVPGLRVSKDAKAEAVMANGNVQKQAAPPRERNMDGVDDKFEPEENVSQPGSDAPIQIRKNFNETAFFFPDLKTDADGNIEFSFTTPEALTKWKLQTLAHTKNLAFGFSQKELVTQKELMVQPNMPRFLRQGDHIELSVKIVNLSQKELTGQAQLQLFDATTNQSVDGWFLNSFPNQYFTVAAGQSQVVHFPVQVPMQFNNALTWRVVARSGSYSDGEENALPVLTNKVLVTETMPLPVRGSATKNFTFEKLLQAGNSPTLQHQSLTVEYTSNPAWYAVQALPYLMDFPYECAEQTWNRYYANALASHIANSVPRIKQIFERWKTLDTAALLSNLQKNQELKSALLEETPWVLQAKSETEQKKNIALLFDMVKMSAEMETNLSKLKAMQSSNGGFVWFKGGPDDRYITQYIITGIGHLKKLGVNVNELASITKAAIPYLDKMLKEDYDRLVKSKAKLNEQQISAIQIQYLYMRTFFTESIPAASRTAFDYYQKQAVKFWMKQNKYSQGMIALAMHRSGDKATPAAILKSLKETSIVNEEMGRYWIDNKFGFSWYWWHAPIETQSLLIEAFSEIGKDISTADELRTWLIKNKQTNNWRTTKATADACYAMLLQGTAWLSSEPSVQIKLGATTISNNTQSTEAGTGYFKQAIDGPKVNPSMGNISVTVQQPINKSTNQPVNSPSWGAVYWQYFEDMDKVTSASTPLKLDKKLFIEKNTDRGPVLTPVANGAELHVGDKIKVRIELRVDRDMEYVHMKDMRASALEPVNVISGYKWQGGLGYYESTKDASTNFFFNYLRKGTYVFEYPLFVTHTGNFSNGITTIQCMYAPEFSAHSEGVKITVE